MKHLSQVSHWSTALRNNCIAVFERMKPGSVIVLFFFFFVLKRCCFTAVFPCILPWQNSLLSFPFSLRSCMYKLQGEALRPHQTSLFISSSLYFSFYLVIYVLMDDIVTVTFNIDTFKNRKYALHPASLWSCVRVCVCVSAGVGGVGTDWFREVDREAFEFCAGLGKKFQSPESQGKRVRTFTQVHITY